MAILQENDFSEKDVSIIISTYNRPRLALSAAAKIREFSSDSEIIIVDQDLQSSIQQSDLHKYHLKVCRLEKPHITKARNAGITAATRQIILFIDDDAEVTKSTVQAHTKGYTEKNIVGIAGRVINDGEDIPKNTNVATGKTNFFGTKFISNFWSTKKQFVDFPYGCNMSFRKDTLEQIGYFDENYPNMFDEVDLAARVIKIGKVQFLPEALVYHHKAPSGGARTDTLTRYKLMYYYYGRYLAKNILFPFSLISLGIRSVSAFRDNPQALLKFIQGYLTYYVRH